MLPYHAPAQALSLRCAVRQDSRPAVARILLFSRLPFTHQCSGRHVALAGRLGCAVCVGQIRRAGVTDHRRFFDSKTRWRGTARWRRDPISAVFLVAGGREPHPDLGASRIFPPRMGLRIWIMRISCAPIHGRTWPLSATFYTLNAYPLPNWTTHLLLAALMAFVPVLIGREALSDHLRRSRFRLPSDTAFMASIPRRGGRAAGVSAHLQLRVPARLLQLLAQRGPVFRLRGLLASLSRPPGCAAYRCPSAAAVHAAVFQPSGLHAARLHHDRSFLDLVHVHRLETSGSETNSTPPGLHGSGRGKARARTSVALAPAVLMGLWYVHHQGTATGASGRSRRNCRRSLPALMRTNYASWLCGFRGSWASRRSQPCSVRAAESPRAALGQRDAPLLLLAALFLIYLAAPSEIGNGGAIEAANLFFISGSPWRCGWVRRPSRAPPRGWSPSPPAVFVRRIHGHEREGICVHQRLPAGISVGGADDSTRQYVVLASSSTTGAAPSGWFIPFSMLPATLPPSGTSWTSPTTRRIPSTFRLTFCPPPIRTSIWEMRRSGRWRSISPITPQRTGRSLDYVLLWGGPRPQQAASPDVKSVLSQIQEGYEQDLHIPQAGTRTAVSAQGRCKSLRSAR